MNKLFAELRRRNVFRVAGVYAVVGWLLAQAAVVLETSLGFPSWFDGVVVGFLLIGFPIAMVLAWAFEVTPAGVKLTKNVAGVESVAPKTNRKLDYAIVTGLALVGMLIVADRVTPQKPAVASDASGEDATSADSAMPAAPAASIAVLPFADLSPQKDQQYFSDGMAEEILNVLARVDGLKVASRTSSFLYRGDDGKDISDIARALGVQHVLEGSVRKAGDAIRITAQLVDGETDAHLWSRTYDRTLTVDNIFDIQDEISTSIVEELGVNMGLGSTNADKFAAAAGTDNLRAYDAYLEARDMFLRRSEYDPADVLAKLEEVVALDPDFARGWSALAAGYSVQEAWRESGRDYRRLGIEAATRALELDPSLAMPHAVIGMLTRLPDGRPDRIAAIENLNRAIQLDPADSILYSWRGQHLTELGFFNQGEADLARAQEIDSQDRISATWLIKSHYYRNDADGGFARAPAPFRPVPYMRMHYAIALAGEVRIEDARRAFDGAEFNQFFLEPDAAMIVSSLTESDYDHDAAYDALKRQLVDQGYDAGAADRPIFLYVFKQFDRIRDLPDLVGDAVWWLRAHKDYLDSPDRYRLMREQGLDDYWRAKGFPPQCRNIDPLPDGRDFECD